MSKTTQEIKRGLSAIRRHLKPFRKKILLISGLGVISALANGAIPYVTGLFFDALIQLSQNNPTYFGEVPMWAAVLGAWIFIQLIANNVDWIIDRVGRAVNMGVHLKIQSDGYVKMFLLPMSYHKKAHINADLQSINQASWRISSIVGRVTDVAPQLLSIFIGIILSAIISPLLAGVLLIGVAVYAALLIKILIPVAEIDSKAHEAWRDSSNDASAAVQQVESVKQAATEEYEIKKTRSNLLDRTFNWWMKLQKNWSNVGFFQRFIVLMTQLTIFALSVGMVSRGDITVGQLITLNGYALMFFGPFVTLGYSWQVIQNGITAAAQAEDVFEKDEETYVPANAVELRSVKGQVTFDHVDFSYEEEHTNVLHDISFTVEQGEVVAFVGESGVGKSTAISLISGYHFPSKGSVKIDGVDTKRLNLTSLRKNIAVVPQEVALFNDTIRENIRYGSFEATDEDVEAVARQVKIHDFIVDLPDKYDAVVGERGIKLSVGQKQRVAIARAMLRNPRILILDEPTSALDAKTEKVVTTALEKLMEGRTTFVIAHRLSTVRKANKIFVFDKGRIVETGTHGELINKKGGVYKHLHDYQVGLHD